MEYKYHERHQNKERDRKHGEIEHGAVYAQDNLVQSPLTAPQEIGGHHIDKEETKGNRYADGKKEKQAENDDEENEPPLHDDPYS